MSETTTPPEPAAGIVHATTRQGYALPVIDVSHPAFTIADDADSLRVLSSEFAKGERDRKRVPGFIMRWMLRSMARRSLLARNLFGTDEPVLAGMSTYVMKLGAANLVAPFNTQIDRRLAAAPGVSSLRIRLQQLARLLAQGLRSELSGRPGAPVHLFSIGGGTAIDCLNALILLRKLDPAAVQQRAFRIHVLDPDTAGPEFGARALEALLRAGPLHGLEVHFEHIPYSWQEASKLAALVREASSPDAVIAVSTEGALFEYGDDATVLPNLEALRTVDNVLLVGGTVTRDDPLTRNFLTTSRFKLVPRTPEEFARLAGQARFAVTQTATALLSFQVLLRPI